MAAHAAPRRSAVEADGEAQKLAASPFRLHTCLYTDGGVNGARDRWYDDLPDGWFQKEFAPVFKRRCYDCHQRTNKISDAWLGRRSVAVTSKVWSDITIMDQGLQIESSVAAFGPEYRINLMHPEWRQMLTALLALTTASCSARSKRAVGC